MTVASDRLRTFRVSRGFTYKALAAALSVHPSMVMQLCTGARRPSLELAARIEMFTGGLIPPRDWVDVDAKGERAA